MRSQPRRILSQVPGLELVDIRDSEICCGSAGLYNILQPDMAERLLENKVDAILETGAELLATGNPGCLMQIAKGLRIGVARSAWCTPSRFWRRHTEKAFRSHEWLVL